MITSAILSTSSTTTKYARILEQKDGLPQYGNPQSLWSAPTLRRRITKTLYLSNGIDWGTVGPVELCEDGSFAAYLEAKFEAYGVLNVDETALNALLLYCVDKNTNLPTGHVSSTVGKRGEWQGMKTCPNGYITGIRARVLEPQGTLGDDVAVQNFQVECDHSTTVISAIDGAKFNDERIDLGVWGDWAACPQDSAICGIEMQYNDVDAIIDDAAISDAKFYCCAINEPAIHYN